METKILIRTPKGHAKKLQLKLLETYTKIVGDIKNPVLDE